MARPNTITNGAIQKPISHSPYLLVAASFFGTVFVGFGLNFLLRPLEAYTSTFLFPAPASASERAFTAAITQLFGIKDLFMATAIYVTAWNRDRRSLGWILVAAGAAAVGDGFVNKQAAVGSEWGHWGYAGPIALIGSLLLGVADGKVKSA